MYLIRCLAASLLFFLPCSEFCLFLLFLLAVPGDMPKRNKSTVRIGKNAPRTGVVISSSSSSSSLCRGDLHTTAGKEVELTTTSHRDLNGDSSKLDLHTNNESEIHKQRSRPKSGQAVANSQTHQGSKKASVITTADSLPKTGIFAYSNPLNSYN